MPITSTSCIFQNVLLSSLFIVSHSEMSLCRLIIGFLLNSYSLYLLWSYKTRCLRENLTSVVSGTLLKHLTSVVSGTLLKHLTSVVGGTLLKHLTSVVGGTLLKHLTSVVSGTLLKHLTSVVSGTLLKHLILLALVLFDLICVRFLFIVGFTAVS